MQSYDVASLLAAGRELGAPFELRLASGEMLVAEQLLRHLPRRRVVARACWRGRTVLLKLFARRRELRREQRGLQLLAAAGLPAPALLGIDGTALLGEFLADAPTLAQALAVADERQRLFEHGIALMLRLHAAGLRHRDPHPDNFLLHAGVVHLVDGGAIDVLPAPARCCLRPLARRYRERALHQGLALFCCQFALADRAMLGQALQRDPLAQAVSLPRLHRALLAQDRRRGDKLARKSTRDCREFVREKHAQGLLLLRRERDGAQLRRLLEDPDAAIADGVLLKDGNSATVARVRCGSEELVIKRYNIRGPLHALDRCWRPSRAWHAWRNAQRMRALGVATPLALAMLEHRRCGLRGRAYLLSEFREAQGLAASLGGDALAQPLLRQLQQLFTAMHAGGCSHGDCKPSNFLLDDSTLWVLDLDGMRRHRRAAALDRALRRDLQRLRRACSPGVADQLAGCLAAVR
jgi:tRNA A-37 threonylcarbamoyl transferase component Bud32